MTSKKSQDTEYTDVVLKGVREHEKGYEIESELGWFYLPKSPVKPKTGDTARFYGRGLGSVVRGVDINGVQVFYRTTAQQKALDLRRLEAMERKERREYEKNKADFDRRVGILPSLFRRRIERFRATRPDWGRMFEEYELFCIEQAIAIAAQVPPDEIEAFYNLSWNEQKARVPKLSDGHSGNTFGFSCLLARLYQTDHHLIPQMHGALCSLVGCQEYGCYEAYPEATP